MKDKVAAGDINVHELEDQCWALAVGGTRRQKKQVLCYLVSRLEKPLPRRHEHRHESSLNILVPDQFVSRLIGRNGENVKSIMAKTNCSINFEKTVNATQTHPSVETPDGDRARVCTFKGSPVSIADGLKYLLDQVTHLQRKSE